MAAVTAAVAVGAGMAYSANRQGAAAKKGARAAGSAAEAAMQKYTDINDRTREDNLGWLTAGQGALSQLQALNSGDFSSFNESPDYRFRFDQGLNALDRSAAARGGLYSGGADADRIAYGQGMASQAYDTFYNRLLGLSDRGQQTAQFLGGIDQNYADQYGRALGQKGQADAQYAMAGPMTQAGYGNALASAFSTYAGFGGNPGSLRQSGYTPNSSLLGQQATSGPGSLFNFGNNVDNMWKGGGWNG